MNEEWGVTDKGFHRPTYTVLLNALEYKARELFGEHINLTVRSPLGLLLRIYAWMLNILFSVLEDVYNSRFADTAAGNSLYNLGRSIGMQLQSDSKATGYITVSGDEGVTIPAGYLVATNSGLQYVVVSSATIGAAGTTLVPIQAVDTGTLYNTPAGTVIVIVNPASVSGVRSVFNELDITSGRKKETDEEYRKRYYDSVDYAGGVNSDAIRAALLNDVHGIASARVYENDTDEFNTDYSLPPHSMEAVVYGGPDEAIARVIYDRKAGGIQTVGNTSVQVISASGQGITIHFSRPAAKTIYIKILRLKTNSEYQGNDMLRSAFMNYIGNDVTGGLGAGEDVIYMKLPGIIAGIDGVIDFDLLISSDGTDYEKANIAIGYREKAVIKESAVIFE